MSNTSQTDKEIMEEKALEVIKSKGQCFYGDIIKELNLSYSKGQEIILSLKKKGLIDHCEQSAQLTIK